MEHRGEIVEGILRKSGVPIARVAKLLGVSRPTIYNKLDDMQLDYGFILRVGQIIKHDFTREFPDIFEHSQPEEVNEQLALPAASALPIEMELLEMQRKYITLMEEHLQLLRQLKKS
jgi:predicted transcriptional regulator